MDVLVVYFYIEKLIQRIFKNDEKRIWINTEPKRRKLKNSKWVQWKLQRRTYCFLSEWVKKNNWPETSLMLVSFGCFRKNLWFWQNKRPKKETGAANFYSDTSNSQRLATSK